MGVLESVCEQFGKDMYTKIIFNSCLLFSSFSLSICPSFFSSLLSFPTPSPPQILLQSGIVISRISVEENSNALLVQSSAYREPTCERGEGERENRDYTCTCMYLLIKIVYFKSSFSSFQLLLHFLTVSPLAHICGISYMNDLIWWLIYFIAAAFANTLSVSNINY